MPIFGDWNEHTITHSIGNFIYALEATLPVNNDIISVTVYLSNTVSAVAKCAIYRVSDRVLMGQTEVRNFAIETASWRTFNFYPVLPLVAGDYYIAVFGDPTNIYCYLDGTGGTGEVRNKNTSYGDWLDPVDLYDTAHTNMSIYATYGGGVVLSFIEVFMCMLETERIIQAQAASRDRYTALMIMMGAG